MTDPIDYDVTPTYVRRTTEGWLVQSGNPALRETERDLFGTDWLPLPLPPVASLETVLAHVEALDPVDFPLPIVECAS